MVLLVGLQNNFIEMLRVTIFIALFALTSVSGTLRLTQSEIEYQENDMTATIEMVGRFLRDMEATTHDVDHFKVRWYCAGPGPERVVMNVPSTPAEVSVCVL